MLISLALAEIVLIDRLALDFGPGLTVLTGETGAGKSILLDGLGLALGQRADAALVAPGAREASAVATFRVPPEHPVWEILEDAGLEAGEELLFRRLLAADGRSRAFINDQPVGVSMLRRAGASLVEIQGQHGELGLAEAAIQRALLDGFGVEPGDARDVAEAWSSWREAAAAAGEAAAAFAKAAQETEWLTHAVSELSDLAPQSDEEAGLAARRRELQQAERRAEAVAAALSELAERERRSPGPQAAVRAALRALTRVAQPPLAPPARTAAALAALERALDAIEEAESLLENLAESLASDPERLEAVETRLFALRAAARKHNVAVSELPELARRLKEELAAIENRSELAAERAAAEAAAREAYIVAAERQRSARSAAAGRLEAGVARELAPLRLEKARFAALLSPLAEPNWGREGIDSVAFLIAANPGQDLAPLARAASGGELARLMLALKVVLAEVRNPGTLIFDEVDAGIGGAAAAAVGERLARIARQTQLLVVTHSPQVAAAGGRHIRITKATSEGRAGGRIVTRAFPLDAAGREEEIARMLAGIAITDAARAAASSLLARPKAVPASFAVSDGAQRTVRKKVKSTK